MGEASKKNVPKKKNMYQMAMAQKVNKRPKYDMSDVEDDVQHQDVASKIDMEYRSLGGTGLKVSALSLGFFNRYGVKEGLDRCVSLMHICRNGGINFFDNAEAYGQDIGD